MSLEYNSQNLEGHNKGGVSKGKIFLGVFLALVFIFLIYFFLNQGVLVPQDQRIAEIEKEFKVDFSGIDVDEADREEVLARYERSLQEYKELAESELDTDQLKGWMGLGGLRKIAYDYEGAEKALIKAGEIYPGSGLAFCNLANLYNFMLNKPELAVEKYKICIKNYSIHTQAYNDLADLYIKLDNYEKAKEVIELGLSNNPGEPNMLIYAAYFYKDNGPKDKAIEYFYKAKEALPERAEYYQKEIDELNNL